MPESIPSAVAVVFFRLTSQHSTPAMFGMLCYEYADGSLRRVDNREVWTPTAMHTRESRVPLGPLYA